MTRSPFNAQHLSKGKLLIEEGGVKSIIFSGGTYQIEIFDPDLKETFWPFLQLDDEGEIRDAFCSCQQAERAKVCFHLAAAFLQVGQGEPLHTRFESSFWNQVCLMSFKRHGGDAAVFQKGGKDQYTCSASGGEVLFSLRVKSDKGHQLLDEMIFHRVVETEETSLKFSNLPIDELSLWKRGTPSQNLQYELSFWSDFAKWMMLIQEFKKPYSIDFIPSAHILPNKVVINFHDLEFHFYIAEVNWEQIIPSLRNVSSPLPVHEFRDVMIRKMYYDNRLKEIHITSERVEEKKGVKAVKVGQWEFYPDIGFFPIQTAPFLKKRVVPGRQMGEFLSQNFKIVKRYLVGTSLSREEIEPQYTLRFDEKKELHISAFMFEEGDLQAEFSAFFYPWVYVEKRGFFRVKEMRFDTVEKVIPFNEIGDFIREHRQWLNEHEGFQIHLSNVEFHLSYMFDLKTLTFESESQAFEGLDGIIDFGDWLYMKEKGFYKKLSSRGTGNINSEVGIKAKDISKFIIENREELEQIKNFFSPTCPIEKAGLNISINKKGNVAVEPEFFFRQEYQGKEVHLFGDFTYVEGEGFIDIPFSARLPQKYCKKRVIDERNEASFINVELEKLKPFIIKIDNCLKRPHHLTLKVNSIAKNPDKSWEADLVYVSEFGEESLAEIKKKLDQHRLYAITRAGLLFFKDPRFNWLRAIHVSSGETLTLSTLEWIRLRTFENIEPPKGQSKAAQDTRRMIQELDAFKCDDTMELEGLKSTLRPYQEVGVRWLWFLYSYGLSGLLCDDMGLGKTHQAMALLAAVRNAKGKKKVRYFVVCPTSVIYHWEELLKKFLPHFKVVVFYGTQRTLKGFNRHADLLLTSYGTLRSEKEALSKIEFEVAILDEIQIAKNIQSQTHHSLAMLKARTKIGLTGTPIENRLLELKALFDIVLPNYLPPPSEYRELFITPIEKLNDQEKKDLLSRLINPFLMRRKKREVLNDLPEKFEEIAYCHLSEEQHELYRAAFIQSRESLMKEIESPGKKLPYLHVFSLLNKLKQICNHPSLVSKDLKNAKAHKSGKWDLFVELVDEALASGQKLVVFSQYLDMMTLIENHLKERNIKYATIRGSTQDRKKQLQTFRDDPNCAVFVASLKAAGTGVDMTAASVVIHYDRWWNPAKENQATDRVHRIGQNRGVQVFKMVTKGTVEEHIHRLIEKKMGLLESVVGYDDEDQIKSLDREDLIALFHQLNSEFQF